MLATVMAVTIAGAVGGGGGARTPTDALLESLPPLLTLCSDAARDAACTLEADGHIPEAFAAHIARSAACAAAQVGDSSGSSNRSSSNMPSWFTLSAKLGNGLTGRVDAGETVCGTPFVLKSAVATEEESRGRQAVLHDCAVMRHLTRVLDAGLPAALACPGCVPRFYAAHGSWCLSESLRPALAVTKFIRRVIFAEAGAPDGTGRFPTPTSRVDALKRLFTQGLRIVQLLRAAGVRHNDLLLRNMLVRWADKDTFQLALMDFCQAGRVPVGHHPPAVTAPTRDLAPGSPGSGGDGGVGDGGAGGEGSAGLGSASAGSGSGLGGGVDPSSHYKWGGSPGTFDQLSLACSFIDALYLARGKLFASGWRTRAQCYSVLPGVVMEDLGPKAHRGDFVPWNSTLTPNRFEYVLLRMTQLPGEGREEDLEALVGMVQAVTEIDEGPIKTQRRRRR